MNKIQYREAKQSDVPSLALIRAAESGTQEGWLMRISGYMNGEHHPQQALLPRILYVALKDDTIVSFLNAMENWSGSIQLLNTGDTEEHRNFCVYWLRGLLKTRLCIFV
jgi:hypothetical protein